MRNKLLSRHDYDSNSKLVYSEEYKYNFKKFNSELSNLEKYEYQPEAEYNIFTVEEAYSYFYIRKHYTRRISLDTIIKTTYPLNSSSNPIIEKAIYSHNKIGQNIKIENNISNGNTLITENKFPFDFTGGGSSWQTLYDHMFDNNFRNKVISSKTFQPSTGTISVYSNNYVNIGSNEKPFYRIGSVEKARINKPILNEVLEMDTVVSISYYSNGNIKEVKNKDGIYTTYIWAYNNQELVAKIVNARIEQVYTLLPPNLFWNILFSIDPSKFVISYFNELRKSVPNVLITTYTYKPLVGMTSKTDSRGVTAFYEYDVLGRLIEVYMKDERGMKQIIEKYDYKYATQQNPQP